MIGKERIQLAEAIGNEQSLREESKSNVTQSQTPRRWNYPRDLLWLHRWRVVDSQGGSQEFGGGVELRPEAHKHGLIRGRDLLGSRAKRRRMELVKAKPFRHVSNDSVDSFCRGRKKMGKRMFWLTVIAFIVVVSFYAGRTQSEPPLPQDMSARCMATVPSEWGEYVGSSSFGVAFKDSSDTLRFVTHFPCGTDAAPHLALMIRRKQ
jgi:hypothetical protein